LTETFLSEDEAKSKLSDEHMKKVFCPLTKDMCRIDCVCYVPSFVYPIKLNNVTKYAIEQGYCSNAMFIGPEEG